MKRLIDKTIKPFLSSLKLIFAVLALLIGISIILWVCYNVFILKLPLNMKNPLGYVLAPAMIMVGLYWARGALNEFRGKKTSAVEVSSHQANISGAIWNPNVTVNWSLPFTPAFGSYLQMLNWQSLGEDQRAKGSKKWFYVSLAIIVISLVIFVFVPLEAADAASTGLFILLLGTWYYASARSQSKYVKANFGTTYLKKPWGKALLYAVGCLTGYIVVLGIIVLLKGATPDLSKAPQPPPVAVQKPAPVGHPKDTPPVADKPVIQPRPISAVTPVVVPPVAAPIPKTPPKPAKETVTEKKQTVAESSPAPKKQQAVSKPKKMYAKGAAVSGKTSTVSGREKINTGDYRGAIKTLTAVIAKNPDESISYRLRGNAYDNLGNRKQAIEDWKKAAALGDTIIQSYLRFLEIDWEGKTH